MRPFNQVPQPPGKAVATYPEWRQDLLHAYGPYCAYCNVRIPNGAEVEHLVAKSRPGVDPTRWDNLLIACSPCNKAKGNTLFEASTHYLPTQHNTYLAFRFVCRPHRTLIGYTACIPEPNFPPAAPEYAKAKLTIQSLKLDRVEQTSARTKKATDVRWENRYKAWLSAQSALGLWNSLTTVTQRQLFVQDLAVRVQNEGFFSIWYKAFQHHPEARKAIVEAFQQTAGFPAPDYLPQIRIYGDL